MDETKDRKWKHMRLIWLNSLILSVVRQVFVVE